MRIAVIGATGNVGTSLLGALGAHSEVDEVIGIARRTPDLRLPQVEWQAVDITHDDIAGTLQGVDTVVHLAWQVQPSHAPQVLRQTNVVGSRRVFEAAADAGVKNLVYASSVGAYGEGPKDVFVDESWATTGIPGSSYSTQKAEVERLLDQFESAHHEIRCVRIRPGLIFKRESASEISRLFLGRLRPLTGLLRVGVPFVPGTRNLRFQGVHTSDVARAFAEAATRDVRGAFNVAAGPVLDSRTIARALNSRRIPIPGKVLRLAVDASWRLHVQPTDPGWIDMALSVPLMNTDRARKELDWEPAVPATAALAEVVDGLAHVSSFPTPRLRRVTEN